MSKKKRLLSVLLAVTMLTGTVTAFASGDALVDTESIIDTYKGNIESLEAGRIMPADFTDTIRIGDYLLMTRGSHKKADTDAEKAQNEEGYVLAVNINNGEYFKLEETGIENAGKADVLASALEDDEELNFAKIATTSEKFTQYHFIPSKLVYDEDNGRLYVGYVAYGASEITPNWTYGGLRVYDVSDLSYPIDITGTINTTNYNYNSDGNVEVNAQTIEYTVKAPLQFNTTAAKGGGEPSAVWDMIVYDGILHIASNWGLISIGVLDTSTSDSVDLYSITGCNWAQNYDINTDAATIYSNSGRKPGAMQSLYLDTISGSDDEKVYIWAAGTYHITRYDISGVKAQLDSKNDGKTVKRTSANRWGMLDPVVAQLRPGTSTTAVDHAVGSTSPSETHLTVEDGKVRIFAAQQDSYVLYAADIGDMDITYDSNKRGFFTLTDPQIIWGKDKAALADEFGNGLSDVDKLYAHEVQVVGDVAYYGLNGGYIAIADLSDMSDGSIKVIDIEKVTNSGVKFVSNLYVNDDDIYAFADGAGLLKYTYGRPLHVSFKFLNSSYEPTEDVPDVTMLKYSVKNIADKSFAGEFTVKASAYKNNGNNRIYLENCIDTDISLNLDAGKGAEGVIDITVPRRADMLKAFLFDDYEDLELVGYSDLPDDDTQAQLSDWVGTTADGNNINVVRSYAPESVDFAVVQVIKGDEEKYLDVIEPDDNGYIKRGITIMEGGTYSVNIVTCGSDGYSGIDTAQVEVEAQRVTAVASGVKGGAGGFVISLEDLTLAYGGTITLKLPTGIDDVEFVEITDTVTLTGTDDGQAGEITFEFEINPESVQTNCLALRYSIDGETYENGAFEISNLLFMDDNGIEFPVEYDNEVAIDLLSEKELEEFEEALTSILDVIAADTITDENYYEISEAIENLDEALENAYLAGIELNDDQQAVLSDKERILTELENVYKNVITKLIAIEKAGYDEKVTLLKEYKDELEIRECTFDYLEKATNRNSILSVLDTRIDSIADLNKKLDDKMSYMLAESLSYGYIEQYIIDYADVTKISMSDYNDLSPDEQIIVQRAISLTKFGSASALASKFNGTVADPTDGDDDDDDVKKITGGGGGGYTAYVPPVTDTENTDTEQTGTETTDGFTDLQGYDWAEEYINSLADRGVIAKASTYRPGDFVTRAEFTKMVVGITGVYDEAARADFTDISNDGWSYSYIASAYNAGLINGIDDSHFEPARTITRQDMAVILARALKYMGVTEAGDRQIDYADGDSIADYAKEAVNLISSLEIMNGVGNGQFDPMANANRAMAAKVIEIAYTLTGGTK